VFTFCVSLFEIRAKLVPRVTDGHPKGQPLCAELVPILEHVTIVTISHHIQVRLVRRVLVRNDTSGTSRKPQLKVETQAIAS
jgi:hypothetical protein